VLALKPAGASNMPLAHPNRFAAPRGVVVAGLAALALHAVGAFLVSGPGWVGRGDSLGAGSTHTGSRAGDSGRSHPSLQVRLASQTPATPAEAQLPSDDPVAAPTDETAVETAQGWLMQAPPAAGGATSTATLAFTYLTADEVDQGPAPEPGWILDEGALAEIGRARLRLQLWVSESGHIDRVAVIQSDPPGPWVERAIQPLPQTRMRPAERDGRAVAATIVVELSADLETLR